MSRQSSPSDDVPASPLDDLRLTLPARARLDAALAGASGLLLVTGPRQSGRSRVLRATAKSLTSPQLRVVAVEAAIEEPMDGIAQVVCRPPKGISVAQGLRVIEKQRPEVILVDPIEDAEVAELALLAAVNGSLVLGAMPALDSVAALYWLLQLNIEPFLLRSKLLLLQSQRLVRRICARCIRPVDPVRQVPEGSDELLLRMADLASAADRKVTAFAGAGCEWCKGTGYVGSSLVCESLTVGPALSAALSRAEGPLELLDAARTDGLVDLPTEVARLVLDGETTLEEALRATAECRPEDAETARARREAPGAGFQLPAGVKIAPRASQAPDDDPAALRVANFVLTAAFKEGVSEVHVESRAGEGLVRFRQDGALYDAMEPPARIRSSLVFHFKRFAALSTDELRLPQLGAAAMKLDGRSTGFSVGTVETLHGENVMLALFPLEPLPALTPEKLGLDGRALTELRRALDLPAGLVLAAGPSRSGRTVTLYAALRTLAAQGRSCVSIEHPIQAELPGVKQLECRPQEGLTFASALRTALEGKPDVILVQELRDPETAKLALQAAEQGTLVLSMVSARQALEALYRLEDLVGDRDRIAGSLALIVAQRLLRKLCDPCKKSWHCSRELAASIGFARMFADRGEPLARGVKLRLCSPVGCPDCAGRGWKNRELVSEALWLTERTKREYLAGATFEQQQAAAREERQGTLREAALEKVLSGLVSVEDALLHTPWDEPPAARAKILEQVRGPEGKVE